MPNPSHLAVIVAVFMSAACTHSEQSAEALTQADPYATYTLPDGGAAVVYRGDPTELRDARIALDAMAKKQPGLMPAIYGSTRLPNGEPALVLERFEGAQVATDGSRDRFIEPYRAVFTPEAHAEWRHFGFGNALEDEYVFLDAAGRPRLALPRRASQFRALVESGRVFQDVSSR